MYPHGRAKVDPNNSAAFAICDRCGFLYNHKDLRWQYDYRGRNLANLRILVCETCFDDPQPQLKPRILPPDPMPILNARPERYKEYEQNTRVTSAPQPTVSPTVNSAWFWTGLPVPTGQIRITENNNTRVTQQTGEPPGGWNHQPGQSFQVPGDNEIGLPYDNTEVPRTGAIDTGLTNADWTNLLDNSVNWSNNLGQNVFMSLLPGPQVGPIENDGILLENDTGFLMLEDATSFLLQEFPG